MFGRGGGFSGGAGCDGCGLGGGPTSDGIGAYNKFSNNTSIFWSPATGAWAIGGAIRDEWARRGGERGPFGYPTTNEFAIPAGRQNNFQHGWIAWNAGNGAITSAVTS